MLANPQSRADYDAVNEFDKYGSEVSAHLKAGTEAMEHADWARAQTEFIAVLEQQPQLHFARDLLGMAYLNANRPADAMREFTRLVARAGDQRGLSPAQGLRALRAEPVRARARLLSRSAQARSDRHALAGGDGRLPRRAEAVRAGAARARSRHRARRAGRLQRLRLLHAQGADPALARSRRSGGDRARSDLQDPARGRRDAEVRGDAPGVAGVGPVRDEAFGRCQSPLGALQEARSVAQVDGVHVPGAHQAAHRRAAGGVARVAAEARRRVVGGQAQAQRQGGAGAAAAARDRLAARRAQRRLQHAARVGRRAARA